MEAVKNLNVAVVGVGYWGKNLVRNFYELKALGAICEGDTQRATQLAVQYPDCRVTADFTDILDDREITAVVVATPAETHASLVKAALLGGKDVYVEKPLCLSVETGQELVALAREQGRILMVGHLLWYHPAILKIQELVRNGDLGRLRYIYSNRLNLGKIRREENILWSFAPHDISVILGLLQEMPCEVHAQGGNYLHEQIADVTMSLLSFPSGVKAHIFVSWLHPFKEQKLVIVGERQMVVFDDVEPVNKLMLYPHVIEWKNQVPVAHKAQAVPVEVDSGEPLRAECEHFLDCIRDRRQPRTGGEEGLRVLRVLEQCQAALKNQNSTPAVDTNASSMEPLQKDYFAHESAFINDDVEIGTGTKIWHVSHVMSGSRIGKNCKIGQNVVIGPRAVIGDNVKIQNNVSVYEGVVLEDDVFCGPSMVFTNVFNPRSAVPRMHELKATIVRRGATLGANSTIVCGTTIGSHAFIGAGAVVTRDVPDYALMMGNPARVRGWMCACGVKLEFANEHAICESCGAHYCKNGENIVLDNHSSLVDGN